MYNHAKADKRQTVVSLTSIPPRFGNLPARFKAIGNQTHRPDRVQLTLPKEYRRFPSARPSLPELPDWVEVVDCDFDFGPATKVLPAAERWQGTPTDLLICDDDRTQDKHWIERLVSGRRDRPQDIICERGWNIEDRFGIIQTEPSLPRARRHPTGGRTLGYKLQRALSFGQMHPPRKVYEQAGYVDVFEGFLGVIVPVEAIPQEAFTIPDIVWTVDDVWLSGMAATTGTKIWVQDTPRPVFSDGAADKLFALRDHVEQGVGRDSADQMAVEYLRQQYGIWK